VRLRDANDRLSTGKRMSARASATRYARALFDVALQESIAERAEQDLSAFAGLLDQHPPLRSALTHPAIPAKKKRGLMQELTSRLGLTVPVTKLLLMLAERDRVALVPEVLDVYRERLLDHQQVIRAEVTTADALSAERALELRDRLTRATGRHVTLTTKVDPAILGGLVTRIGSIVYDGSLAAQLAKMRERLTSSQ
jgi:F-type H+-transporting ATPase subunit delta